MLSRCKQNIVLMAKNRSTNKVPAVSIKASLTGEQLAEKLQGLIWMDFKISGKLKQDGSILRKMVETLLFPCNVKLADKSDYTVIPPNKKGVPKLVRYMSDTFIVTTGSSYNLQVWNREPNTRKTYKV